MDQATPKRARLGKADYEMLADFRYALRRFLSFSETAARGIGLASQQYQALLAVKGCRGPESITINELARNLLIKHNSAVGLVNRLEAEGLVRRQAAVADRRKVDIVLTPKGTRVFERLAAAHHAELGRIGPQLKEFLEYVSRPSRVQASSKDRARPTGRGQLLSPVRRPVREAGERALLGRERPMGDRPGGLLRAGRSRSRPDRRPD